jgi:hypothetical protein
MTPTTPFSFRYWNSDLIGLALGLAAAGLQKIWRSYLDRRSETWLVVYGRIDRVSVDADSDHKRNKWKCFYSYKVSDQTFVASFHKVFESADEAETWAEALAKRQVAVRYDPEKPSRSRLREVDLVPLVQAAAPFRPAYIEELPGWQRAVAVAGLTLSIVGLSITVAMLIGEILDKAVVPLKVAVWTGGLAFVLFFGGLWSRQTQSRRRTRALPAWMKFLGYAFLYYAILAAVVPGFGGGTAGRHRGPFYDARYLLFLYFSAFEWWYAQLRRNDDGIPHAGIGELH